MSPATLSTPTLLYTTIGTGLCVSAANTFNQVNQFIHDAFILQPQFSFITVVGGAIRLTDEAHKIPADCSRQDQVSANDNSALLNA